MIFIEPIIITNLVGKHIVITNFIKVYSITDGHFQTLNSLMMSQHDATEICCSTLSVMVFYFQFGINGWYIFWRITQRAVLAKGSKLSYSGTSLETPVGL